MTLHTLTRGLLAAALAGIVGIAVAQVPAADPAVAGRVPWMDEEAVAAALADAGYRDIRGLELSGAVWKAEAVDGRGIRVDLRVNARNGSISQQAFDGDDPEEPEERDD